MKKENERSIRAFNMWINFGDKRTFPKVAKYMEVPDSTVYRWRKNFNWDERLQKMKDEIVTHTKKQLIQEDTTADEEYVGTIGRAIKLWVEEKLGSEENMRETVGTLSMGDIRELMKLYNSLKKELSERTTDGATERLAAKIYNELVVEQLKEIKAASRHLPPSSSETGPGDVHRSGEQTSSSSPPQDLGEVPDGPEG